MKTCDINYHTSPRSESRNKKRKILKFSRFSSLSQSNHTRLRSGTGETSKTANFFTHTGFSRRTSIDEDQHAKHEQQWLRFPSCVHDQSHVRGLDLCQIHQRGRDAGPGISKFVGQQETGKDGQLVGGGNAGRIHG